MHWRRHVPAMLWGREMVDGSCKAIGRRLGVAMLVVALCRAGAALAQPAEQPPDNMATRTAACAACHGAEGRGTTNDYFPRLAGKPAGYLMNQLVAFRDGRRRYPPMNYLLEYLPDPFLKAMAEYFASEQPQFPPPATPVVS